MSDIEKLTTELRKLLPLADASRSVKSDPWPPAIKVIDCVLSLHRNYRLVVQPRVADFAKQHSDIQELAQLQTFIQSYATPFDFSVEILNYKDRQRAQVLVEVIDYLLHAQEDYEGNTETERLEAWANDARPGDYLAVGVKGFGLAGFQYLRMLFGAQTAKPDVHIVRFISEAVGRQVTDIQALLLLERAAKRAGLPLREADSVIWESRQR